MLGGQSYPKMGKLWPPPAKVILAMFNFMCMVVLHAHICNNGLIHKFFINKASDDNAKRILRKWHAR